MESLLPTSDSTLKKLLLKFIEENQKYIAGYLGLSLVFPLSEVLLPHYYGKIIDGVSKVKNPANVFAANAKNIKIVIGLWLFNQMMYGALYKLDEIFIPKLQSYVRKELVDKIVYSHAESYYDLEVGEILSRVFKLPMIVKDLFRQIRNVFLPTLLIMLAASGYLFYVHPLLGSITFIAMMIFIVMIRKFAFTCVRKADDLDKRHDHLHEEIDDLLSNLLNIYAANTLEEESERLNTLQTEYNKHYRDTIFCASKFKWMFNLSYFMFFLVLNGSAMRLYSQKKLELSNLSSVLIVSLYLINQLSVVSHEIRDFIYDMGTLQQIEKYVNALGKTEIPGEKSGSSTLPPSHRFIENSEENPELFNGGIAGDKLSVNIKGKNIPIQFELKRGELMTLTGSIGCGKSTAIKSIMKLHPYKGTISIDDIDLQSIGFKELRELYIYIPQQAKLFNRKICENIAYGTGAQKSEIRELAEKIGFKEDLNRLCGKNGSNLSGGQRQIVHMLRALLNKKASIVVLDEPTSAMDSDTEKQVVQLIELLVKDKICIVVSHNTKIKSIANYNLTLM